MAVIKGVAKSGMPFLQKAVIIVGGSIAGGLDHSVFTTINIKAIYLENNNKSGSNISSKICKFLHNQW